MASAELPSYDVGPEVLVWRHWAPFLPVFFFFPCPPPIYVALICRIFRIDCKSVNDQIRVFA